MSGLTPKQEKFAQKYIELSNASEAYRQAYNAENMSNDAIKVEACRLLQNPNVALTVMKIQEQHAERHRVTVDSITKELDEARSLAMEEKQTSAAISASMGKAKIHGLIIDKAQQRFVDEDGKDLHAKDIELLKKLGIGERND